MPPLHELLLWAMAALLAVIGYYGWRSYSKVGDVQAWKQRRAEGLWKEAFELQEKGWYGEALPKWEQCAQMEEESFGPRRDFLGRVYNEIGFCNHQLHRYPAARHHYERALSFYSNPLHFRKYEKAFTLNNLALLLLETGHLQQAEKFVNRSLKILEQRFGKGNPQLAQVLNNMAKSYIQTGQYAKAREILDRVVAIEKTTMCRYYPEVMVTLHLYAEYFFQTGSPDEAESCCREVLSIKQSHHGQEHPVLISTLNNLASFYVRLDRVAAATSVYERILAIIEAKQGPNHPTVGIILHQIGRLHFFHDDLPRARSLLDRAMAACENDSLAAYPWEAAVMLYNSALVDCRLNRWQPVEKQLVYALVLAVKHQNPGMVWRVQYALCCLLSRRGQADAAIRWGKLAVYARIGHARDGEEGKDIPKWLFVTPQRLCYFLSHLLITHQRTAEAQGVGAMLGHGRSVSTLHGRIVAHLRANFSRGDDRDPWLRDYRQWQARAEVPLEPAISQKQKELVV